MGRDEGVRRRTRGRCGHGGRLRAGLAAADARFLHSLNQLTLRLLPCDVGARVAFAGLESFQAELEIARRLAEIDGPVASLEPRVEPRVYERHGFAVTLWTHYEKAPEEVSPADYAKALAVACPYGEGRGRWCRTSRTTARKLNNSLRARTELQGSKTRGEGSSAAHYEARDARSANGHPRSNCCMESRTRATCSTPRAGRCS